MPFAFALFSPDCVLSGSTGRALRFMADRGVQVIAYRWHSLAATEVARLYASNRKLRPSTLLDQMVDELFSLSPSLCCLVTSTGGLQGDALHRFLLDIKGPSDPFNCRPNQLRRALGATNKILNLVHTSDSPPDSLREGMLFFPEIHHLGNRTPGVATETLCNECPPEQVPVSGFRTVNDLKRRSLLAVEHSECGDALGQWVEIEGRLLESQLDHVTIFSQLRSILGQQARAVAAVRSADLRALMYELIAISARTADAGNMPSGGAASVLRLLKRLGLNISAWESLVIKAEQAMAALPSSDSLPPVLQSSQ